MSLTLTTFGATDPIDATELRARNESVRRYVGEEILAADRGTGQLNPTHVYRPDFFNDRAEMVSGAHWWGVRGESVSEQLFWNEHIGTSTSGNDGFYIPALTRTIHIPENISTNGGHRVKVQASFVVWEYGGDSTSLNPACDESTYPAWAAGLMVNATVEHVTIGMKGSNTGGASAGGRNHVQLYPRKQVCFVRDIILNAGVHDVGVWIMPRGTADYVRHRIVGQGCILIGFNCR